MLVENIELRAKVNYLESMKTNWEYFDKQLDHNVRHGSLGASGLSSADDLSTVKQETEKLRHEYENFMLKCQESEKNFLKQRADAEREHNAIAKERQLFEVERLELEKKQRQLEELRCTLQSQWDLYKGRGLESNQLATESRIIDDFNL